MDDESKWRNRFYLFMGARLFGLATFLLGIAVMFSDLVRPGGWPAVGGVIVVLGLIDSVVAPNLLKKQWKKEDDRP
ncbi:MAG TPA: hypothetical protein VFP53_03165 [Sphingomicrobium sp.]|nr:hypothetical protein [Sphingomicrobium sp.]